MYQRNIPHLPEEFSREEFINHVFDLGLRNSHSYESIITSVQLGDKFVNYQGPRTAFRMLTLEERTLYNEEKAKYPDEFNSGHITNSILDSREWTFIDEIVPQVYSIELAYTVTVIVAKANEEYGYRSITYAASDIVNRYVIKMEWEICILFEYHIRIYNFLTILARLCPNKQLRLGSIFQDISKEVCLSLLDKDPKIVTIAILILHHRRKLQAFRTNRKRIFHQTMLLIAHEYELNLGVLLREYIRIKNL